ncbi:MAG TPA: efflux RND transporter permease subunit [Paraburkholderia sp.]|nr:efflux RND transporter permease subunit [Paraburkholderia sp.]
MRLNLSAPFIRRPIATSLLMVLVLLLGVSAYFGLPIAALPQMDIPTIEVSASLPGAGPDVMAATVTSPLERQLALIAGVTEMTSTSILGNSSITLQFDLSRNIDAAAQDVQGALNAAAGDLPRTLPHPPTYEKANPADFQIMSLAVRSSVLPLYEVDRYADIYIAQQLSRVPGVGLVDLHGEQKPAVRVQIDPDKIAALGISLEEIRAVLGNATVSSPKGTLDGPHRSLTVESTDQLFHASAFDDLIIAWRNGAPVHIRDVGRAIDSVEDVNTAAWYGKQRAIVVDIHKAPGANVVATVDAIKALLPSLESSLPSSVAVAVVSDRTQTIRASVADIQLTMLISVLLVVLVVFAFLRGIWATLIPAVAIPLSIVGTFAVMYGLGFTINNLTLMGLTIAVGFVVDDAIVMIENIMRHLEHGEPPLKAALEGARQVGFTVLSMTLSLIAAFIPLLFMGGVVGRLFREFSVTVSVALAVSAVVSLTLTPMMCRLFLHFDSQRRHGRLEALAERVFDAMLRFYERTLDWALARRALMLAVTLAAMALSVLMYWFVPKGFFPQQDTGQIIASTDASPGISAPAMAEHQQQLIDIVRRDPDVAMVYSWIGEDNTLNNGRIIISLKPFSQRHASAAQIIERIGRQAAAVPGIVLHMQARQDLQVGGRISRAQFQYTLEDADLRELYAWTPRLIDKLKSLPSVEDVNSDLQRSAPGTRVAIDRNRAASFGISPQLIDDTLYDALGQRQVATIFTDIDQYHVVLEVDPARKIDVGSLNDIYVPSDSGKQVPLSVFAHFEDDPVPLQINHQGQFPAVTLSFNLAPGAALGDAVAQVNAAIHGMRLPATLHASFQGTAKAFESSLATQPWLIAAALAAVYIVLGILYESYIHPLTILSTLPSAGLGALLALQLFGLELDVISLIGIILLIGIVKKNAIMMIDFALEAERKEGKAPIDAIYEACLLRFRPIMMTTMAALLGGLPLALGAGVGSELRRPLGITIVGGLILSQILTLYTTPVVYLAFDWLARRFAFHIGNPIEETAGGD